MEQIQQLLEMTAVRDRDLEQQLADEWIAVDEESWADFEPPPSEL